MKRKRSILVMGLAFCAFVPAVLMMTACGGDKGHEHTYSNEWSTSATEHWHGCMHDGCEESIDRENHSWSAGEIITEPTATTKGEKKFTCTECDYVKTEDIDALGAQPNQIKLAEGVTLGKTYDRQVYNLTVDMFSAKGNGAKTLSFKKSTDTNYTTTAPVSAGEYKVKVSVEGTAEWQSCEETFDFTISKKVISEDIVLDLEYNKKDEIIVSSKTLAAYGVYSEDDVSFRVLFNRGDVNEINNNFDFVEVIGADEDNYDFKISNFSAKVVKRKLTLPNQLNFTRNASDKRVDGVYKFENNVLEGDEVWLINTTTDIENPKLDNEAYIFAASELTITDTEHYELKNIDASSEVSLTVVNDEEFFMAIQELYSISGQLVIDGVVNRGEIKVGDILDLSNSTKKITVVSIKDSTGRQTLSKAIKGDRIGVLISGVERDDLIRGDVVSKQGSLTSYYRFTMNFRLNTKDEGGRIAPINSGYVPQAYLYKYKDSGTYAYVKEIKSKFISLDVELLMPGESSNVVVELESATPIYEGMEICFKEGSRIVGIGTVTSTHAHSTSFETIGKCAECGYDRTVTMQIDSDGDVAVTQKVTKGTTYFFKGTLESDDWGLVFDDTIFDVIVYTETGVLAQLNQSDLYDSDTYIIKATAKASMDNASIKFTQNIM